MTDAEMAAHMDAATTQYRAANALVSAHFWPRLKAAIAEGRRSDALDILDAMPDCSTKALAMAGLGRVGFLQR